MVAKSIYDYFQNKGNIDFVKRLINSGVIIEADKPSSGKLSSQIFVLTGGLESMSRDEAKEKIRSHGGDISESVSKETSFVVAGYEPGSKYIQAKQLNVKIINEREFLELIGAG